jgi:hypothetical protein
MSLTSENLVGYLKAEFGKAAKLRIALFFIQLAVALPGAISVVVPDDWKITLYLLAIVGVALLAIWWVTNGWYVKTRAAGQAALRGALLLGGLAQPLSASAIQSLRERFTVSADQAKANEQANYYATQLPPGPGRLAEMLEESALYTEHLQRISSYAMAGLLLLFGAGFLVILLFTTPFVDRDIAFVAVRLFLAMLVFVMSADVLGAFRQHRAAAADIKEVRQRLSVADRQGYPLPDVLLAMADYTSAIESAPESVPWAYKYCAAELDARWRQYLADRAAARAQEGRA